jgi:uncharacterized protein YqgV (UPF0045/DUF77 family)
MAGARVEFTVEPFEAGAPGDHVHAAVAAAAAIGGPVDVGPFASSVDVEASLAADVVRALVSAALAQGATRVAVQVEVVP